MEKRVLIFLLVLFIFTTQSTITHAMTCSFEHVAMIGFPHRIHLASGPATQAYGEIYHADLGPDGEIYFVSQHQPGVFVIDNGIISRVAGMERRGYRDGPAEYAMFNGRASGYPWSDIAVDSLGNIYVTDGDNKIIRKIFKDCEGRWMVSTFAGGGTIMPSLGETVLATDLDIGSCSGIAVDQNDYIWINRGIWLIKINSITGQATPVCEMPEYLNSHVLSTDNAGTIYGIGAPGGPVWRYSETDGFEWLITKNRNFDGGKHDGPIENASTISDSHIVSVDGSIIYFGGNDENGDLRKIEDEGDGLYVRTLMPNDTWAPIIGEYSAGTGKGKDCGAPAFIDETGALYLTHTQYATDTTKFRKMTCIP